MTRPRLARLAAPAAHDAHGSSAAAAPTRPLPPPPASCGRCSCSLASAGRSCTTTTTSSCTATAIARSRARARKHAPQRAAPCHPCRPCPYPCPCPSCPSSARHPRAASEAQPSLHAALPSSCQAAAGGRRTRGAADRLECLSAPRSPATAPPRSRPPCKHTVRPRADAQQVGGGSCKTVRAAAASRARMGIGVVFAHPSGNSTARLLPCQR